MKCTKCGAENEEWSEYCYQCNGRLRPLKFRRVTMIGIVLSILESIAIFLLQLNAGLQKMSSFATKNKIMLIGVLGLLLLSLIGMLILLLKKRIRGLILSGLAWIAFLTFNIVMGGSPIFSFVLLLPALGVGVSLIPDWKDMQL